MGILSQIAEKIKPADTSAQKPEEEKQATSTQVLDNILSEVKKIATIITATTEEEQKKPKRVEPKTKKEKLAQRVEKPAEVQVPAKKDGEKVSRKKKKAKAPPAPGLKPVEAPKEAAAPAEAPPPKEDQKGLLDGLIDMLKSLFMPIIAVGGIGVFLSGLFTMVLEGLGMNEEGSFFNNLIKTITTLTKPIVWAFDNIIKPVGTILLTAIKEYVLGIGQMWDEAKLFLMGDSLVAKGIRKLFGVKVDEEEKKALEQKVYEGRRRQEERMAGYIERATGKRPVAAPPSAERTPAAQPPSALAPTPAVQPPAPTPAVTKPAPTPAAAVPAGPPPAPSIKPTEPTLKPAAPAAAPGGVQSVIVQALKESGITSTKAVANILATVKAESNFKPQSENLNYTSAERIVKVFGDKRVGGIEGAQQLVKNPEALANKVYAKTDGNSAEGDGYKYRGRGFIQHTGKNQYKAISDFTGLDLIGNPDLLNDPGVAAKAIAWFFLKYKRLPVEQLDNMSVVNRAVAFSDPTGEKARAREQMAASYEKEISAGGGTMVAQAPTTGQAISVASAEVGSEKARSREPAVNVTYVNATKVTTATKTSYG